MGFLPHAEQPAFRGLSSDFSLGDVPLIGGLLDWTQDKARQAVQSIVQNYATYVQAKQDMPAMQQRYTQAIAVANTPAQQQQVADWGAKLQDMQDTIDSGGGFVDQVVAWYDQVTGQGGHLSQIPIIPIGILLFLGTAFITVTSVVNSMSTTHRMELAIKAGMTPEQIGKIPGLGGTGGATAFLSSLSTVGWVLLAGAAFLVLRPMLKRSAS